MAFHWKTVTTKYGKRQYRADLPDRRLVAERGRGWKCRLFRLEQGVAVLTAMVQHQPSRDIAAEAVLRAGSTCLPPRAHQSGAVPDTLPLAAEKAAKSAEKLKDSQHTVVRQDWEESERGWGVRPDGYSLHLTIEDRDKYIAEYWEREKEGKVPGFVPPAYTRDRGLSRPVTVGAEKFAELNTSKAKKRHGVRY